MNQYTPRSNWNEYFMAIARAVATRATCDRRHVGAVLVIDKAIVATGYNGSMTKLSHCDDVGHLMIDGHCERTIHAEANAIAQAAKGGHVTNGATAYVTTFPCMDCFKLMVNSGVHHILFESDYVDPSHMSEQMTFVREMAAKLGVTLERLV